MDEMPPWEPPFDGTEVEHLLGALDRQRATFRWKVDGLDDDALARTVGASSLTLGGLMKHLACVEDEKWGPNLSGAGVARSRQRLADAVDAGGLDQQVALGADQGVVVSLRRLVVDLLEEYARHTGHADLLREAVDGRVGEDPPPDWRLPAPPP